MGAVALLSGFGPPVVWAGRPLETEDTGTVAPGAAELELSANYARNLPDNLWGTRGVLTVGLLPGLDARVESTLLLLAPQDRPSRAGIGDSLLGIKYHLLDDAAALPAVLGALTLRLPTGDAERGLGAEGVDVGLLAAVSKALGPMTLTWNVGYTFVTRDTALISGRSRPPSNTGSRRHGSWSEKWSVLSGRPMPRILPCSGPVPFTPSATGFGWTAQWPLA